MRKVLTTCGYCGCGCNLYLSADETGITGVQPSPNHPVSRGMLCSKGWQGHGFVRHPDRLTRPLIRREDDSFEPVSWDEAYAFIHRRLGASVRKYGPSSFAMLSSARCTNEENYLATKFARSVLGSPNIDHCARL